MQNSSRKFGVGKKSLSLGLSSLAISMLPWLTGVESAQALTGEGGQESEKSISQPAQTVTLPAKAYVLQVKGRALPLKAATIDGVNVLGGPIVSLTLPVNVSGFIKKGLNEIKFTYVSDPKSDLSIVVERRLAGPKTEEVARLVIPADASKGEIAEKSLTFNISAGDESLSLPPLSDTDKKAILEQFETYYSAVKEHRSDKLLALYKPALDEERKLVPETVRFFEKVLNREAQDVKNPNIQLPEFDKTGLNFEVEGTKVRLFREGNKALFVSNEIEVQPTNVMFEIGPLKKAVEKVTKPVVNVGKGKKTSAPAKAADPKKIVEVKKTTGEPEKAPQPKTTAEGQDATSKTESKVEDKSAAGDNAAAEPKTETKAFDKVPADWKEISTTEEKPLLKPQKGSLKKRLIPFNLYFTKSPENAAAWVLTLPPHL